MAHPLQILLVDDQPRARASLKAVVKTWLHTEHVMEAESGEEAIRRVQEQVPDVILMDAKMPEMDGITATRLIKRQYPKIHIIVLSIYSEYRARALEAGADMFLNKAEPVEHLLAKLSAITSEIHGEATSLT